jgi:hypothetical protein
MHEANVMSSCLEAPACDSHPATLFGKLPSLQIQCTTQLSPLFHRHPVDNNNDNNKNQNTEEELHKMPFLTGSGMAFKCMYCKYGTGLIILRGRHKPVLGRLHLPSGRLEQLET